MLPLALIAGAAVGAGELAYGAHLKKKAQEAAAANVMPEYKIAPEEQQMLSQAESSAGQGMSDAAREALRSNSDRALGTTVDAMLRSGGTANSIGKTAGATQAGLNQVAIYEDSARLDHLRELQNARARMSANRDKSYQINKYNPWANKAQAISEQLAGANNVMNSGINTLGQGVLGIAGSFGGQPKMPSYNYIPPSPTIGQLPGMMTPQPEPYQPQSVQVPPFQQQGQPFGMMNENIDNTPVWNGYSWV
jgi:hypothetical protein